MRPNERRWKREEIPARPAGNRLAKVAQSGDWNQILPLSDRLIEAGFEQEVLAAEAEARLALLAQDSDW